VLSAVANWDREVGYVQGMNFIAAFALLQIPEPDAFRLIVQLLTKYKWNEIYRDGMQGLLDRLATLQALI
jgi:hypothetical protein